jgi:arabinan endo-1,5-alpha-L-arabinosidase
MRSASAICTFALLVLGAAAPTKPHSPATYTNPVLDADFPDPTVIRAPDGTYYAYGTQTQRDGRWINIQVATSSDLVHWRYVGDAMPRKPAWASTMQDFWAPHVQRAGKRYIMYLSVKPDGSDEQHGLCLGVATASSPMGPFTDVGHPLKCGAGFVNIDPMAFDDPATGKHLLYWGSGFEPIKVQELSADRLSFKAGSKPIELVRPTGLGGKFPVLIEGPWVVRHGGYYYLFTSGDNCCGPKANYAVLVARSRSATGPFQEHGVILRKSSRWNAPGHNSIVTDPAGQDWIVYHAVDTRRPREKPTDELNTRRILLIDRIRWRSGWPVIDGPSEGPRAAPVTR